jgi:hypothetical protein
MAVSVMEQPGAMELPDSASVVIIGEGVCELTRGGEFAAPPEHPSMVIPEGNSSAYTAREGQTPDIGLLSTKLRLGAVTPLVWRI